MTVNTSSRGKLEVSDALYLAPSAYRVLQRLTRLVPKDGQGRNALEQFVASMVDMKTLRVGRDLRLTPTMGYVAITATWTPPEEWRRWELSPDEWETYIEEAHSRALEELDAVRRMLIQLDFFAPVLELLGLALQEVSYAKGATTTS